jgi:hypothetical protein
MEYLSPVPDALADGADDDDNDDDDDDDDDNNYYYYCCCFCCCSSSSTLVQLIYNYIPEANHVSRVPYVAAILWF